MGCLPQRRTWLRWRCCWLRWGRPNKGRCGRGPRVGVMAALAELSGFCVESCGAGACFGRVSGGGLELVSCLGSQTPSSSNSLSRASGSQPTQQATSCGANIASTQSDFSTEKHRPWGLRCLRRQHHHAATSSGNTPGPNETLRPGPLPHLGANWVSPSCNAVCRVPCAYGSQKKAQKTQAKTLTGPPRPPPWAPPPQTLPRPHPPRGPATQRQLRTRL